MTEDEAKQKLCIGHEKCGELVGIGEIQPIVGYSKYERRCVGSKCMAWVWIGKEYGETFVMHGRCGLLKQ